MFPGRAPGTASGDAPSLDDMFDGPLRVLRISRRGSTVAARVRGHRVSSGLWPTPGAGAVTRAWAEPLYRFAFDLDGRPLRLRVRGGMWRRYGASAGRWIRRWCGQASPRRRSGCQRLQGGKSVSTAAASVAPEGLTAVPTPRVGGRGLPREEAAELRDRGHERSGEDHDALLATPASQRGSAGCGAGARAGGPSLIQTRRPERGRERLTLSVDDLGPLRRGPRSSTLRVSSRPRLWATRRTP